METDVNIHKKKKKKKSKKQDNFEIEDLGLSSIDDYGEEVRKHKKKRKKDKDQTETSVQEEPFEVHAKKNKERANFEQPRSKKDAEKKKVSFREDEIENFAEKEHRKTKKRKHVDVFGEGTEENVQESDPAAERTKKKHKRKKKISQSVDDVESFSNSAADIYEGEDPSSLDMQTPSRGFDMEKSKSSLGGKSRKHRSKTTELQSSTIAPELLNEIPMDSGWKRGKSGKKSKKRVQHLQEDGSRENEPIVSELESATIAEATKKAKTDESGPKRNFQGRADHDLFVVDQLLVMVKDLEFSDVAQPLDFDPPLLHSKNSVRLLTKQEKEALLDEGVTIKTKKWTKKEDAILQRNMMEFIESEGIPHPALLLGFVPELRSKLRKYLNAKNFFILLGKDLNDRLLHSIYKRARRIFSPYPRLEKLTQDDMELILHLQARKGNKWASFAPILNRDPQAIEGAVRWRSSKKASGRWTEEEERLLRKAVEKYLKKIEDKYRSDSSKLPWEKIARKVGTRNASQCHQRWTFTLSLELDEFKRKWTRKDTACLLYLLYSYECDKEGGVDWGYVTDKITDSLNVSAVKKKWLKLKYTVPNYKDKDFEDIVLYLYHHHLPTILSRVKWTMDDLKAACA